MYICKKLNYMAKKQVTMQLDESVIKKVVKDAKRTKRAKQVIVNNILKINYGL